MVSFQVQVELDDLLKLIDQLPPEQKRLVKEHLNATDAQQAQPRTPGLHAGMIWASDDFDDPLPDEFWLGEDS